MNEFEELQFDAPLEAWLNAGKMELLPGCEPPIPQGLTAMEALEEGFVRFTSAGLDLLERRIDVIEQDLHAKTGDVGRARVGRTR